MSTPTSDSSFDESDSRGQFFLSGSQPLELMESASESLAGRVGILELAGLSLREIQETSFSEPFVPTMSYVEKRSNSAKVPENLWEIIHRGSYPELQNPKRDWASYLPPIAEEVFYRKSLTSFRSAQALVLTTLLSACLYALEHTVSPWGIYLCMIWAIPLSVSYIKTRNVYDPMTAHLLCNLLVNGFTVIATWQALLK